MKKYHMSLYKNTDTGAYAAISHGLTSLLIRSKSYEDLIDNICVKITTALRKSRYIVECVNLIHAPEESELTHGHDFLYGVRIVKINESVIIEADVEKLPPLKEDKK